MNNHPKFKSVADFLSGLWTVTKIYALGRLEGGPVLRPWIQNRGWLTPYFREQICLVVTKTNHCVG